MGNMGDMAKNFRREISASLGALFLISLGGLLLHLRIHPVHVSAVNWVAVVSGVLTCVVVPILFWFRRTVPWAYLITVASVVIGTVGMAWFSVHHWAVPVTVKNVILQSTLADIVILLAKWPLAHQILRKSRVRTDG